MSPEMIPSQGDDQLKHGYGKEVDWWSLGCVFFEMLTGSYPFEGGSSDEIFESIRHYADELPNCATVLRQMELSDDVIDLVIFGFLSEPKTRLGKDLKKVQQHNFFKDWDWDGMDKMDPDWDILFFLKTLHDEMDVNLEHLKCEEQEVETPKSPKLDSDEKQTSDNGDEKL